MSRRRPLAPIQHLMQSLQQRLHHIVAVIDDALHSDQLKDRIWAVEQLFKRLKPEDLIEKSAPQANRTDKPNAETTQPKLPPPLTPSELEKLTPAELEARLLAFFSSTP